MLDEELRAALWGMQSQLAPSHEDGAYRQWFSERSAQLQARYAPRRKAMDLLRSRSFALVLTDLARDADWHGTVEAMAAQSCPPRELFIVGADAERLGRIEEAARRTLAQTAVRAILRQPDESEIRALNRAIDLVTTDFIAWVAAGDRLAPVALALVHSVAAERSSAKIIYCDEDWIDVAGRHLRPRFKSAWDPDAQLGADLLGRLCCLDAMLVREAGGLREELGAAAFYDLHCRLALSLAPSAVRHVPAVVYHRRMPAAVSTATPGDGGAVDPAACQRFISGARTAAAEAASAIAGAPASASASPLTPFINRIEWPQPETWPKVSILVPTRDRAELLTNCARGVLKETDYPDIELVILDNDSEEAPTLQLLRELKRDPRVRVIPCPGPFNFSAMNNLGAACASGRVLVMLNNDIEVLDPRWLRDLVVHALRPEVGCVGAKLLYADRTVQHAGVLMQPGPLAMHAFRVRASHDLGDDGQLAGVRSYLAVTAACLAVRREVFEEVGGLDADHLKVAFNDVDFCLRVNDAGFRNICVPFAPLLHLESASRGYASSANDRLELTLAARRWSDKFLNDPYVNDQLWYSWDQDATLRRWSGAPEALPVRVC